MAKVQSIPSRVTKRGKRPTGVHQFLIVLKGTDSLVWRRIQVPDAYSFWAFTSPSRMRWVGSTTTCMSSG